MLVPAGVQVVVSCSLACICSSAGLEGGPLGWACPAQALLRTPWGLHLLPGGCMEARYVTPIIQMSFQR